MDELYTDDDLVRASGLSMLHVRRLITWGAVTPDRGGKGVVRGWEVESIFRVARIAALFDAGFSLRMAHTLSSLFIADNLFAIFKPGMVLANDAGRDWYESDAPIVRDAKGDMKLIVANGALVGWQLGSQQVITTGVLTKERSHFVSALDYTDKIAAATPPIAANSLAWEYDAQLAEDSFQAESKLLLANATSLLTVNFGLACRIAGRRLLELPIRYMAGRPK